MLETIAVKVMDILQADARLFAGGNAYAEGWTGVCRVEDEEAAPKEGWINLFDEPYDMDSANARPAVYAGLRGQEIADWQESVSIGRTRIEYRALNLPLVIAVQAQTKRDARLRRNQLRGNIRRILLDHVQEDGAWYELTTGGNGVKEKVWTTSTGGGEQGVAEGMCIVPLLIKYTFTNTSPS